MAHLTKAFVITTIAIVPILAAPMHFGQDDVELISRNPFPGGHGIVRSVANHPLTAHVASSVASTVTSQVLNQRDLEGIDARAPQDELNSLDVRDVSEDLEARDDVYTLSAREPIDSMKMEARRELSDDLEARQHAELSEELD